MTAPSPFSVIEHDILESTNDEACRLASDGAAEGTVVWAHRQRAGRGRRGRQWQSPAGNLYFSAILRPAAPPAVAAQLSLVAAVAMADTLVGLLPDGTRVEQKWPNDVLVEGKKIAGILLESSGTAADRVDWVAIGCGLNIAVAPDDTALPATCLSAEGGTSADPKPVLMTLLGGLHRWCVEWDTAGIAPVRKAWLARARGLGQEITVRLPTHEFKGHFLDMDDSGALIVRLPDGSEKAVTAGDVFL
jgi:BirA family biotin operon repressor/biotin-[acetyl-CoA-carboxylase] ligase